MNIFNSNRSFVSIKITMIANPIAASAAATVNINIVNICPTISEEKIEKEIRFIFTAKSIKVQQTLK